MPVAGISPCHTFLEFYTKYATDIFCKAAQIFCPFQPGAFLINRGILGNNSSFDFIDFLTNCFSPGTS